MKKIIVISIVLFLMLALLITGVSAASESESNDTAKTADSISVNTDVSGTISRSSDVDWYKFVLPKDGYVTVEFKHELISSTSAYWSVCFFQSDAITGVCDYDQRWEMAGNTNGATPRIGLKAGAYYFVVTKGPYNTSNVEYIFNLNYTETENTELEPNSNSKNATEIDPNKDYAGSIAGTHDVDWYKLVLPEDGYVTVDFKHEILSSTSSFWTLSFYRADAVTGICDYDQKWEIAGNQNGATPQLGLKAGTYYFAVARGPYNTSNAEYVFNVNYTETKYTELEPNSSSKNATEIELNKDYAGSIAGTHDVDWYKLVLPEDGYVTVDFKHEILSSTSAFWTLFFYQADGVTGVCDYDQKWEIAGNQNGATPQLGLKAGTYYFAVARGPYNTSSANYTFNAKYTQTKNTELESNSSSKNATEIEPNKDYAGSIAGSSDIDWYKFELSENGHITVDFKHELLSSTSGFWNFYLYQADGVSSIGNYSLKYQVVGDANLKSEQIGLKAGVYYLQITRGDYNTSNVVYTVNVNFVKNEYTELEPNSSVKDATDIKANREYSGSVGNGTDVDWYKLTLSATAEVTINFRHEILSSTSNYWTVNLYKEDGVTVLKTFNVSGNENGSFEMGSMGAGTYFVMVTCDRYHTSNVTYNLSITEKHDCKGSFTVTKEPTCTQSGEQQRLCDVCGKILETQTVAPVGHKSDSWTVDIEPTCNSTGSRHAVCSVCNENVTEEIAKLEHVFDNWKTVKEPTCKVEGSEERTCSLCNHKEEKSIEKLEHRFGDWEIVSGNVIIPPIVKEQECELCGFTETVNDWGYVWVTALAGIAFIGLIFGVLAYIKAFRRP